MLLCTAVYLVVGIAMFYLWPIVQQGIALLGNLVVNSGYIGTWIYGITERALIPFGLHHVFYMPFWQTAMGGTAMIDGAVVQGAQNIFFAELASKATTVFSVSATRFMSGKFPFMIFGLVGAALAMYHTARPEKKKVVGGLLLSAALTSMLTGITEPLEFMFMFCALPLYIVYALLQGCAFAMAGMAFSSVHILDGENQEDAPYLIADSDLIILAGGHVPTQLAFFHKIRLKELLEDYGGTVLGISAGSMNMAKTVYVQPEEPGESHPDFRRFAPGMGVTRFQILPHYQKAKDYWLDGKRLYEEVTFPDSMGREFFALPDGSYFYQDEDGLLLCGKAYRLKDGIMEQLTSDEDVLDTVLLD